MTVRIQGPARLPDMASSCSGGALRVLLLLRWPAGGEYWLWFVWALRGMGQRARLLRACMGLQFEELGESCDMPGARPLVLWWKQALK